MTVNRATLAILSTLYLIVGSAHEEARLRARYGDAYAHYQQSDVPFFFPVNLEPVIETVQALTAGEKA